MLNTRFEAGNKLITEDGVIFEEGAAHGHRGSLANLRLENLNIRYRAYILQGAADTRRSTDPAPHDARYQYENDRRYSQRCCRQQPAMSLSDQDRH